MRLQATHKGECQICGRTQKLPGGAMAKHGYTVTWGWFNGTCQGADHLPFEQDKSLVHDAIRGATIHQSSLVKRIEELQEDTSPAKAHVQYYKRREGWQDAWVDTDTIVAAGPGSHSGQWVAPIIERDGQAYEAMLGYRFSLPTATQAAYDCNVRLAKSMERTDLAGITQYIAWQTLRAIDWAVRPLQTIS